LINVILFIHIILLIITEAGRRLVGADKIRIYFTACTASYIILY